MANKFWKNTKMIALWAVALYAFLIGWGIVPTMVESVYSLFGFASTTLVLGIAGTVGLIALWQDR